MRKRVRVLHVLWTGGIGGAEEYVTTLVDYFDPLKYDVQLCFLSEKGPIFEEIQKKGANPAFIGMKSGYDMIGALRLIRYLYREKYDIIHSHSANYILNIIITFLKRPGKIYTEHVSPGAIKIFKERKAFYKLFSGSYHIFIAISEYVKQSMVERLGINPDKIVVVYNGVQIEKYNSLLPQSENIDLIKKNDARIIGFVGRMHRFKRPDLFVDIAAELISRDDKLYFVMAGEGPELEKCRERIADFGINDHFQLLGFRRDIPNLLKSFDALLFTSVGEGFGVVLLEAMAAGTVVCAVKDGAIPEIIRDMENGILCDSADPKVFAEKVLAALKDKELMAKIKKQSIEDANNIFSIKKCATNTEEIYKKVLNR